MLHLNLYEWRKYLVDICTQSSTRLRFIVKRGAQGNRYYSTSSAYATQAGSAISNKRQCQQSERPSSAEDWALSRLLWHWWALKGPQWTSFYLKPCGSDIIGSSLPQEGLTSHTTHTTDHRTHTLLQNNSRRCWRMSVFQSGVTAPSHLAVFLRYFDTFITDVFFCGTSYRFWGFFIYKNVLHRYPCVVWRYCWENFSTLSSKVIQPTPQTWALRSQVAPSSCCHLPCFAAVPLSIKEKWEEE